MDPSTRAPARLEQVGTGISEEQYRQAMERALVGEALVAPDGAYLAVNAAMCDLFGMGEEELLGTRWQEISHPDDVARSLAMAQEVLSGAIDGFRLRKRFIRPDGRVLWGDLAVSAVRDERGRVEYLVAQVTDLSELIDVQQALADSADHYRTLAEHTGDVVMRSDLSDTIQWVSPSCERALGWTAGQMVGRTSTDFVHPEDAAALRRGGLLIPEGGESRAAARFRSREGGYRWFERLVDVVYGPDDHPTVLVTRLRDIDDEVVAEQQLVEARQRAADGESRLRAMLDSIFDPFAVLKAVRDERGAVVDFVYAEANEAACRSLGRSRAELLGASMPALHPGVMGNGMWDRFVGALENGELVVLDDVGYPTDPDGGLRYYDVRAVPSPNTLHLSWRDVTDRHQAADRLARSERRLHATIDSMLDPHLVLEAEFDEAGTIVDFRVVEANPAACAFLGSGRVQLLGRRLGAVWGGEVSVPLFDRYVRVVQTGEPLALDEWQEPNGGPRRYDVRATRADGGLSLSWRDVSSRYEQRRQLLDSEARLKATIDTLMDPHMVLESVRGEVGAIVDFAVVDANAAACEFSGVPRDRLIGVRLLDQLEMFGSLDLLEDYVRVVETGIPLVRDDWYFPEDVLTGRERWYDIRVVRLGDGVSQTWRDVTERHRTARLVAESEEHYRMLAENATDVVVRVRGGILVWVSPSIAAALGGAPTEWEGTFVTDWLHPAHASQWEEVVRAAEGEASVVRRLRMRARDGDHHWVEVHARRYLDAHGRVDGLIASFRVVDAEVAAEDRLQHLARHDSLTGLLNRAEALDRLVAATRSERREGVGTAVLFCDIDDFKALNDRWGHLAGDEVLRVVAGRILERLRDTDAAARLGGDELLVILEGVQGLDHAVAVAAKLMAVVEQPIPFHGAGDLGVTFSIGVTIARAGEPIDEIIARADTAMYEAKAAGRRGVVAIPVP